MPKITFSETGDTYEVPEGTSFLEFCQETGAPHNFGCTAGSCGTCCLVIEAGAENVGAVTEEEQDTIYMVTEEPGARLGCQITVNGDITVRQYRDRDAGKHGTGL